MSQHALPAGASGVIREIAFDVRGDLDIRGDDISEMVIEDKATVHPQENGLLVKSSDDVTARVPRHVTVRVIHTHGDLEISQLDGPIVLMRVRGDAELSDVGRVDVERVDGDLELERVAGPVDVRHVGGDADVEAVAGDVVLRNVGSDAQLESVQGNVTVQNTGGELHLDRIEGTVTLNAVGGDLHIDQVAGTLTMRDVGGDAMIHHVRGDVQFKNVGGDLLLDDVHAAQGHNVGGDVTLDGAIAQLSIQNVGSDLGAGGTLLIGTGHLNVGGDASMRMRPGSDARIAVTAGGDIDCRLETGSDVTVLITDSNGRQTIRAGEGLGQLALTAGGEVSIHSDDAAPLRREVRDRERRKMGWFSYKPGQSMPPVPPIPPMPPMPPMPEMPDVGAIVSKAIGQALGQAFGGSQPGGTSKVVKLDPTPVPRPVSEEERLAILRMLAEKKITVEQAEQLLAALEGA